MPSGRDVDIYRLSIKKFKQPEQTTHQSKVVLTWTCQCSPSDHQDQKGNILMMRPLVSSSSFIKEAQKQVDSHLCDPWPLTMGLYLDNQSGDRVWGFMLEGSAQSSHCQSESLSNWKSCSLLNELLDVKTLTSCLNSCGQQLDTTLT